MQERLITIAFTFLTRLGQMYYYLKVKLNKLDTESVKYPMLQPAPLTQNLLILVQDIDYEDDRCLADGILISPRDEFPDIPWLAWMPESDISPILCEPAYIYSIGTGTSPEGNHINYINGKVAIIDPAKHIQDIAENRIHFYLPCSVSQCKCPFFLSSKGNLQQSKIFATIKMFIKTFFDLPDMEAYIKKNHEDWSEMSKFFPKSIDKNNVTSPVLRIITSARKTFITQGLSLPIYIYQYNKKVNGVLFLKKQLNNSEFQVDLFFADIINLIAPDTIIFRDVPLKNGNIEKIISREIGIVLSV